LVNKKPYGVFSHFFFVSKTVCRSVYRFKSRFHLNRNVKPQTVSLASNYEKQSETQASSDEEDDFDDPNQSDNDIDIGSYEPVRPVEVTGG
jgi:hypothetical protein